MALRRRGRRSDGDGGRSTKADERRGERAEPTGREGAAPPVRRTFIHLFVHSEHSGDSDVEDAKT